MTLYFSVSPSQLLSSFTFYFTIKSRTVCKTVPFVTFHLSLLLFLFIIFCIIMVVSVMFGLITKVNKVSRLTHSSIRQLRNFEFEQGATWLRNTSCCHKDKGLEGEGFGQQSEPTFHETLVCCPMTNRSTGCHCRNITDSKAS